MPIANTVPVPALGPTGLDGKLSEEVLQIKDQANRFARNVMRPLAADLDRMPARKVAEKGSPIYDFFAEVKNIGLVDMMAIGGLDPSEQQAILPALFEELGWGDCGLGLLTAARDFALMAAQATRNQDVIQRIGDGFGCFIVTQPDRGCDAIDHEGTEVHEGKRQSVGNLTIKRDGTDFIINGQSSAWISGAPIATCGILYATCDYGDGFYDQRGALNFAGLLVPFDEPGVSKGLPLEKLGQRSLPQGEVFFDSVRVPKNFVVAENEQAHVTLDAPLNFAKLLVAMAFVGVARAAYDHVLAYVHERRQGGVPLIMHQNMRARVFNIWRKLEASRGMVHRAVSYNFGPYGPHTLGSLTAKIHSTETALDVTTEAIRIFGGNGLTHEYPLEKLVRDCQASLIEDGENYMLALIGGGYLSKAHKAIYSAI